MWRHACRLQGTVHVPCMQARVQWVVLMVLVCFCLLAALFLLARLMRRLEQSRSR